ncbi:hypothetical protein CTheo_8274 [Ceratobasidium theobromae]|uniref:Protein kinase domain-containing protein n=1 Tax=Ceratobasidium theobromae TaxID=1582974 RepID=A0A5N5Q9V0_9AGAM|nr:hypothetical protein CTheo_8274 [Ceratobasidium theobromae]
MIRSTHTNAQTQGSRKTSGNTLAVGAPFALHSYETKWVRYQPYLLKKGYKLRPRYDPDWSPAWAKNNAHPLDFEDSWAARSAGGIDAIRVQDQQQVFIRISRTASALTEGMGEIEIMQHLSTPRLRASTNNHMVPLLDMFTVPDDSNHDFIVTPLLTAYGEVPFVRFGEVMDFLQQILEGINFFHSNNVALRNSVPQNIMMDPSPIYNEPFHPVRPKFSLDGKRRLAIQPRVIGTVRYYFVNFQSAIHFPPIKGPRLVTGHIEGPELSQELKPYDPFKLDVLRIGFIIKDSAIQQYRGFEGLQSLVDNMTVNDSKARIKADRALEAYMRWAGDQGPVIQNWRLLPLHISIFKRLLISGSCYIELFLLRLAGFLKYFGRN